MAATPRSILAILAVLALGACARAHSSPDAASAMAAGQAFMTTNAQAPGVHVTPSGLQYKILSSGPAGGRMPTTDDQVKVNYEGKLLDGTVFDSSYQRGQPAVFGVTGLIPAWTEALQLMRPGDVWMLYAPSNLAYGDEGAGPIPPGSALVFKIELIAINPAR